MLTILSSGLVIVLAILLIIWIWFKRSWQHWKCRNVESLPTEFPFGNVKSLIVQTVTFGEALSEFHTYFKNKKNLKYAGYYFFFKPILLVLDLELIKNILSKDFNHFTDRGMYSNKEKDPLSAHLFSLTGQRWKNLRAKLTPTFSSGKLKMMFPILVKCSRGLIDVIDEHVEDDAPVDIKDVVARYTTDIIGSTAFGIECDSLKNPESEFRKYGEKFFQSNIIDTIRNFFVITSPGLLRFLNVRAINKEITDFFMNIIRETVSYRETNDVKRNDFMQLLIQLKNGFKIDDDIVDSPVTSKNPSTTITMNELAAQAFVFFLAGFETSSTTLTFCLYELTQNLDVQERLRTSIDDVLGKYKNEITYDALNEMVYMDKCIYETLRKYPSVPVLARECTKTYKVPNSNFVIEKGTLIHISTMGIQRDPENYPDPLKFDPERFSPENKALRHSFAWLPFGEGPRMCTGMRFGLLQTKMALCDLIRNYKVSLNYKTKTPIKFSPNSLILNVEDGVWLNVKKIK